LGPLVFRRGFQNVRHSVGEVFSQPGFANRKSRERAIRWAVLERFAARGRGADSFAPKGQTNVAQAIGLGSNAPQTTEIRCHRTQPSPERQRR